MLKFFFYNYSEKQTTEEIIKSIETLVKGTTQYEWMEEYMLFVTVPTISLEGVLAADTFDRHRVKITAERFSLHDPLITGEISLDKLKAAGVDMLTTGLADNRESGAETNDEVADKVERALKEELKVLLGIGENEAVQTEGVAAEVLQKQLQAGIRKIPLESFYRCAVLYKPLWAFAPEYRNTDPSYRDQMFALIRETAAKERPEFPEPLPLIYGGCMEKDEARELLVSEVLDGVMIDSSRMDTEEFEAFIHSCY